MDISIVRDVLLKVLQDIQLTSGLACPPLDGKTKPIEDLPEFDSFIWPVAASMLAKELGVVIADDINVFREEHHRRALTVDETVALILEIAHPAANSPASAVTP